MYVRCIKSGDIVSYVSSHHQIIFLRKYYDGGNALDDWVNGHMIEKNELTNDTNDYELTFGNTETIATLMNRKY